MRDELYQCESVSWSFQRLILKHERGSRSSTEADK
jgi:hypothetical protein